MAAPEAEAQQLVIDHPAAPERQTRIHWMADAHCAVASSRDAWLYVASPLALDAFPAVQGLIARAASQSLQAVLASLEDIRPLAFVAIERDSGRLHFGRSLDGFASLYFAEADHRLIVADAAARVAAALGTPKLDEAAGTFWQEHCYLEPETSFHTGVKRCFAGVQYQAPAASGQALQRRLMTPDKAATGPIDTTTELVTGLREMYAGYGNKKVALLLSGGMDSRVLLVGLMDAVQQGILHRDQILCTSVLFPGFDCDESEGIRQIMAIAGFEWIGIEANAEKARRGQAACLDLPAPPFPTAFMGSLCRAEARKSDTDIMLGGYGGDELCDFNLHDLLAQPLAVRLQSLDLIRFVRRSQDWKAGLKSLLVALLGRGSQRALHHLRAAHHLPPSFRHVHRLGMRLNLARGTGYEMAAQACLRDGMSLDIPFLRGPFFTRFDPASSLRTWRYQYKAIARHYLDARGGQLVDIQERKVPFDAVIDQFLLEKTANCDPVDSCNKRNYAAIDAYRSWCARQTRGLDNETRTTA